MPTYYGAKAKKICSYMFKNPDNLFITLFLGEFYIEPESNLLVRSEELTIGSPKEVVHAMQRIVLSCGGRSSANSFFKKAMKRMEEKACRNM